MKSIDEKIEKYLTELGQTIDMSKIELNSFGYKDVKAKCCGTCGYYKGVCRNLDNMKVISKKTGLNLPVHAGLAVQPTGLCPNYVPVKEV